MVLHSALAGQGDVVELDLTRHLADDNVVLQAIDPGEVEWHLPDGRKQTLRLDLRAAGVRIEEYDEFRFEIMPLGSQVGLVTRVHALPGPDEVTNWYLKFRTRVGEWAEGRYDLRLDDDGIFLKRDAAEAPDGALMLSLYRRVVGVPGEPQWRKARLRRPRLVRRRVTAEFDVRDTRFDLDGGELSYTYALQVGNRTAETQTVRVVADSATTLRYFAVTAPATVDVPAGETRTVPIRLAMSRALAMRLPPLYSERIVPKVLIDGVQDSDVVPLMGYRPWPMWAVVPLLNPPSWTPATFQAFLRARAKVHPGISAWVARLRRAAAPALTRPWPIPTDIMPGHTMGYRCQKCRVYPRPLDPTQFHKHKCPTCGTVYENDERLDTAYVGRYYGTLAKYVRTCALAYLAGGDVAWAERAVEILAAFAAAHPSMPKAGMRSTSGATTLGCNSLLSSYVLPVLAEGYWFLGAAPALGDERRAAIRAFLVDEAVAVARHSTEYSNQTAEHFRAYATVAVATGFWPLAGEAIYGEFGWHEMVEYAFSEDGVGHEAGAYHRSIFGAMNHLGSFMLDNGVNLYTARFKRVFDGSLLLGEKGVSYETAYRVYRDVAYLRVLAEQRGRVGEDLALRGVLGLPEPRELPMKSKILAGAGYVFLRTGNVADSREIRLNYIKTFDRSEHDKFSTLLFRNGTQIDGAVGRIIYSSPRAHWMYATAAHSAIVIDGDNTRDVDGRLLAADLDADVPVAVVVTDDGAPLYDGVKQLRGVAIAGSAYVVFDQISMDRPRVVDRYQYGRGDAKLYLESGPVEALEELPESGEFSHITGGQCGRELRLDFANGLKMRLAADHDMTAYTAVTRGGWQASPCETTFARVRGARTANFAAAFVFGADGEPPSVRFVGRPSWGELTLEVGGGTPCTITVQAAGGKVTATRHEAR